MRLDHAFDSLKKFAKFALSTATIRLASPPDFHTAYISFFIHAYITIEVKTKGDGMKEKP